MTRLKNQIKAKEPVHLRFKKLSNGNTSIYLDIYSRGRRSYEFLRMYLVPERDSVSKKQNEEILTAANAIKSRRIIEMSNSVAGISVGRYSDNMSLREWMDHYFKKTECTVTRATRCCREALRRHLENCGAEIPLVKVDKAYCLSFLEWLQKYRITHVDGTEKLLCKTSVCVYIKHFVALLNAAVREDLIPFNPFYKIDRTERPQPEESKRAFLTIEEVKKLMATPSPREDVKRVFLFACFCGLRWSDVSRLCWSNLENNNGKLYINIVMQKTQRPIYIPISRIAAGYLPPRDAESVPEARVFKDLPSANTVKRVLEKWTSAAGITKKVTFHVSRHTFATTSLTLGADLFTTSSLLGHSSVTTTQIYARIINKKKDETVALFDKAF